MAALRSLRTMRDRLLGRLPLYEEITPSTSWTDSVNGRNLIIDIPGFKKEEVNIEIAQSGNITIKGRHDVGNNRFRRFSLTVEAPENTDMKGIVGNIQGGFYTVVFPKMDVPEEAVQEGTEPEKKQLELDGNFDKGKEAALDTEASDSTEKAAAETLTEAAVEKTETTERDLETPTNTGDTSSTVKDTILEKTMEETYVLETEKVTKMQDETATEEEMATKTLETSADQEPQTISKIPEATVKEPETVINPTETAPYALGISATSSDNATTKMDTGPAEPETNTLTEMSKGDKPGAPDTAATNLKTEDMVKYAIRNEEQENEGVKKDGGLLENAIEMITEHKACIISVILAFSMGVLISRRISSLRVGCQHKS